MENPRITRRGCCVPPKLDEETLAMLRKTRAKYGPVMKPVPPIKRYKFKRTLECSPAETKRIEEAKHQRLAREAEEAATGIKRQHRIAYSAHTTNVDPAFHGLLLPVDLSEPFVSDNVPIPSFQTYLDTYLERTAAANAAAEARAAALAARPRPPRIFIDPQMKLMLVREHEAALAAAAGERSANSFYAGFVGTKVQAECVETGLKRPCDDSNTGTSDSSETHADNVAL